MGFFFFFTLLLQKRSVLGILFGYTKLFFFLWNWIEHNLTIFSFIIGSFLFRKSITELWKIHPYFLLKALYSIAFQVRLEIHLELISVCSVR